MNRIVDAYDIFIAKKLSGTSAEKGFLVKNFPESMKPFQKDLVALCARRERYALFANTGLGKTLMQLTWADALRGQENAPVIIFTPLAVAEQTVSEAAKFGISDVAYAKNQEDVRSSVVVTNYERLQHFDPSNFVGVVLDESSILKSQDAKTRLQLTTYFANTRYKLCCSATPSPNDFVELGNHAEFLGVSTQKEMLATFFVHDGAIRADVDSTSNGGWRLKGHAAESFWDWVSSWAAVVSHPCDLGYEERSYNLPKLTKYQKIVASAQKPEVGFLLADKALTLSERQAARRSSIDARAEMAASICATKPNEPWLVWCGLNSEADAFTKLVPESVEVRGSDTPQEKIKNLLGFCQKNPRILVSKTTIAGFGMNWQHCSNMIFIGINDSFEQLFQAIRRCWRFGQTRDVDVWFITSSAEGEVLKNIERKERDFNKMTLELVGRTALKLRNTLKTDALVSKSLPKLNNPVIVPSWLCGE